MNPVATFPERSRLRPWLVVTIFALAMAWVESAVVYYLRTMLDRIVPYQPNPLPFSGYRLGLAELIREGATLVMLATVGWLAGRNWRTRLGHALLAFGVWDIAYYLWLVPLTGWPQSPADWDILFLIPLPWWGPVWAPVSIAALMIAFGLGAAREDEGHPARWPGWRAWTAAVAGALLALYVFMADAIALAATPGVRPTAFRDLLPESFLWPQFLVALALMSVPVVVVLRPHRRPPASPGERTASLHLPLPNLPHHP